MLLILFAFLSLLNQASPKRPTGTLSTSTPSTPISKSIPTTTASSLSTSTHSKTTQTKDLPQQPIQSIQAKTITHSNTPKYFSRPGVSGKSLQDPDVLDNLVTAADRFAQQMHVTKAVSLLSIANNYCDLQSLKDRIKNHLADVLENVESAKYYAGTLKIPTSLDLELMPPEELKQDVGGTSQLIFLLLDIGEIELAQNVSRRAAKLLKHAIESTSELSATCDPFSDTAGNEVLNGPLMDIVKNLLGIMVKAGVFDKAGELASLLIDSVVAPFDDWGQWLQPPLDMMDGLGDEDGNDNDNDGDDDDDEDGSARRNQAGQDAAVSLRSTLMLALHAASLVKEADQISPMQMLQDRIAVNQAAVTDPSFQLKQGLAHSGNGNAPANQEAQLLLALQTRFAPFVRQVVQNRGAPVVGQDDPLRGPSAQSIAAGWNDGQPTIHDFIKHIPALRETDRHIPRIDGRTLSMKDFVRDYVKASKPVILTGLTDKWRARKAWTKASLLRRFSKHFISVNNASETFPLQAYNREKDGGHRLRRAMTVEDFLNVQTTLPKYSFNAQKVVHDPIYSFYPMLLDEHDDTLLDNDFQHPDIFQTFEWDKKTRNEQASFAIGPPGSGTYFHMHMSAWRAQIFGKTKWYLLPPHSYPGPMTGSMIDWLIKHRSTLPIKPVEATTIEGDIMYIPTYWLHATFNLEYSVGVAVQVGAHDSFGGDENPGY